MKIRTTLRAGPVHEADLYFGESNWPKTYVRS